MNAFMKTGAALKTGRLQFDATADDLERAERDVLARLDELRRAGAPAEEIRDLETGLTLVRQAREADDGRRAQARAIAREAIEARQAGDLIFSVSAGGETSELVSRGGSDRRRCVWKPGVEVRPYGRAPCRFAGQSWVDFATGRLTDVLLRRIRVSGPDEFEGLWHSLEDEFAEQVV